MHIPLAKLTMTSLKESFCPVKKITSCKIYPLPIQQFLVAGFIFFVFNSAQHSASAEGVSILNVVAVIVVISYVSLILYYLTFLMIDTFRFLFSLNNTCDVVPIFCEFVTPLLCYSFIWVLYYLNDKIIIYMHIHV